MPMVWAKDSLVEAFMPGLQATVSGCRNLPTKRWAILRLHEQGGQMTCGTMTRCGCVIAPCALPAGHKGDHYQRILKDGRLYGLGRELTTEEEAFRQALNKADTK